GAQLQDGQRALDVGAGTGLLALEAQRRVGPSGEVVALDISYDALRECQRQAGPDGTAARPSPVVGSVVPMPFRDGSFDAVLTRSVLIYVVDKAAAVREL